MRGDFHPPHHEGSRLVQSGRPDSMPEPIVHPGGVVHQCRLPAAEVEGKLKNKIFIGALCRWWWWWWMGRESFINLNRERCQEVRYGRNNAKLPGSGLGFFSMVLDISRRVPHT